MSWMDAVGGLLSQYAGGNLNPAAAEGHFDQVAAAAPQSALGGAVADMFRSHETPPFPQLAGQLFANADGTQKASVLNSLLSSAGPTLLSLLGGAGLGSLANMTRGGQVTPEAAQGIPPQVVQQMAEHAERRDPSIVDRLGSIYSQHPGLIKTLGSAALAVTLAKLANRQQG
ncbi:MAG: hypothetical protein ABI759_17485 [Candidatus Solibacter sp.]